MAEGHENEVAVGRVYGVFCSTGERERECVCVCARACTHIPVACSEPVSEITEIPDLELFLATARWLEIEN